MTSALDVDNEQGGTPAGDDTMLHLLQEVLAVLVIL